MIRHPEVIGAASALRVFSTRNGADPRRMDGPDRTRDGMGAFVYMLRCSDGFYCVGSATGDDLTRRINEHQAGAHRGYTFNRRPVTLVWSEHFPRITDAIAVERQIKGRSRAKKAALIEADWASVQRLSKRRAGRPNS